jgi:hypothetical protein
MRLVGLFATLLILTPGCAPTGAHGPPGQETSRRCFSSVSARLVSVQPERVYVRTRTGQTLELSGDDACIQAAGDGAIDLRPAIGPNTGNICIGQEAHLGIASHAAGRRSCVVQVVRVVPQEEINQLPGRRTP